MGNTKHEKRDQLKTNKTIIAIITTMLVTCRIPFEGRRGCVDSNHKGSHPAMYTDGISQWGATVFSSLRSRGSFHSFGSGRATG